MTSDEKAHEIVQAIVNICGLELADKRPQIEACVKDYLDEIERRAAERAVGVIRDKATEASTKVLSETAIRGAPVAAKTAAAE